MLKILLGISDNTVLHVDRVFKVVFDPEWLEDPMVKEMIADVDKSEVISSYAIKSPVLDVISPDGLSGGVKALILMLKTNYEIWGTACGDNCAKWILKIAKKKDIVVSFEHLMNFPEEIEAEILNTGRIVHGITEFMLEVLTYGFENKESTGC